MRIRKNGRILAAVLAVLLAFQLGAVCYAADESANTQAPGVSAALQAGETVPAEGTGGGEGATDVLSGAPGGRMAV